MRPTAIHLTHGPLGWLTALATALALAACAGPTPSGAGAAQVGTQTDALSRRDGLFAQPVRWTRSPPNCQGECARVRLDSLSFPGQPALNAAIEQALLKVAPRLDDDSRGTPALVSLSALSDDFLHAANVHDELLLTARLRLRSAALTVLELEGYAYRTGMAHGAASTRFLNWDNRARRAITLDDLLKPGARPAFDALLHAAHQRWLEDSGWLQGDPQNFERMWPFTPSDNVAVTDTALVVKYQPYEIAPWAAGQPELALPWACLRQMLRAQYQPPAGPAPCPLTAPPTRSGPG